MFFIKRYLILPAIALMVTLAGCSIAAGMATEQTDVMQAATVPDTKITTSSALKTSLSEFSGLPLLEALKIDKIPDPENSAHLSEETIEHSYGVASNFKPHSISVNFQDSFDKSGYRAICLDRVTKEKVVYLTFDCGWENGNTDKILDILKEKKVPSAFFCTLDHIETQPELIGRMIKEGHIVGNHSATHPDFSLISRTQMAEELTECTNYLRENFGYNSTFFRFPKGNYSQSALNLVDSLGYTSVFWSLSYGDWDTENTKGKDYAFQKVTSRMHPGAIILLHSVNPDNAEALSDIIDWTREQGYKFLPLTDLPTER